AMSYSSSLNLDPGSARLAKENQTLQRGRAEPFARPIRHQSMHRSSRSHAERRAQGTKRLTTIACQPESITITNELARKIKVSGSMHRALARQYAERRLQPRLAAPLIALLHILLRRQPRDA